MEQLKEVLDIISLVIDLIGISILVIGFIRGFIIYIKYELQKRGAKSGFHIIQELRCKMGLYILLALDVMIASDIIHSTIHTEMDDLYELAIIVLLRTAIGFFLGKEIDEIKEEETA
jgi:uncharacterized membrane protein